MVRLKMALWVSEPEVAVIVTCKAATEAVPPTVNSASMPELTVVKPAVTPVGRPDIDIATFPANPLIGVMETAVDPLPPWRICRLDGASAMEKSAGGLAVVV